MARKNWVVGVESIAHQGKSTLYDALKEKLEEFRKSKNFTSERAAELGFASLIETHCGISTKIVISEDRFKNAMVQVPQLDKNHPIINNYQRIWASNDDLESVRKFTNNRFSGTVDKADSKVYGDFSKLTAPITLSRGLLDDARYTAGEIAAIILHELGHLFSYFERLIDVVSANYAITHAVDRVLGLERDKDRIQVLYELDKYANVEIPDKESIVQTDNKGSLHMHVVSEVIKQRRNEEGDELYSYRGFEFSADQFATRHGAGADLVTGLDKIYRETMFNPSYRSWPLHIMMELMSFVFTVAGIGMGIALAGQGAPHLLFLLVTTLLAARPMDKIYDDPKARYDRIRNEMVDELKSRTLSESRRKEVLEDLARVEEIARVAEDKMGWLEAIWAYVIPSGNENRKRMKFQKELEKLAHNNLFVASARLQA